jgi:hypothetical protein
MNNPQKVHEFLKTHPRTWICDDCVGKNTGVDRHEVNTIGWTLSLFPKEFRRQTTACSQRCSNRDKVATQAL